MFKTGITKAVPRIFAHSVQSQHFNSTNIFFLFRKHHPALASHHIFSDIKAKTTKITKSASFTSFVFGFYGMGAVFNHC
ncbi:hypothetical protein THIOM_003101 [Candidatus Thiomargarita nelsonii]|uniref:Uncharacterized protein n=1 Tax=Candidatus Thiomargarita nelsonii TaxID=1003181 RepID=A0A176RZN9_9GAMM|nr:hypothetical protein THIOM_003101 [Candidatus Thiomargarita nelsonii]